MTASTRRPSARLRCVELERRDVPIAAVVSTSLIGLTDGNELLHFASATPGVIDSRTPILNLESEERVMGIDYRPSNGVLYAITTGNRVITLNADTGVIGSSVALQADPNGATARFGGLIGSSYGIDFDPVSDRLRVVTDSEQNLRIEVGTGFVTTDPNVTFANPNTPVPAVRDVAYRNNFSGSASSPLFGLNDATDSLTSHTPPPTDEMLTTVGAGFGMAIDVTAAAGFDIVTTGGGVTPAGAAVPRIDLAYATLNTPRIVAAGSDTGLYTVDLARGSATSLGLIGTGATHLRGLAAVPAGTLNFSISDYPVSEGVSPGTVMITVTRTGGTAGAVSVDYTVAPGTAGTPGDYTATPSTGTLRFAAGIDAQSFTIAIADDGQPEGNETILLALSNATGGAVIGSRDTARVIISDPPAPAAPAVPGTSATPPAPASHYVEHLYEDILGRRADPQEVAFYNGLLAAGVAPADVVAGILNSPEGRTAEIGRLYRNYLRRDVDASGLATFSALLAKGGTLNQVAAALIGSAEYFANSGRTDADFLRAAYRDILDRDIDRDIDRAGQESLIMILGSEANRGNLAEKLLVSSGGAERTVRLFYNEFLHRDGDKVGLDKFIEFFGNTGSIETVIVSMGSSAEYIARAD